MVAIAQTNRQVIRARLERPEAPIAMLVAASLIVAVAIVTGGAVSKTVNGVGGILWIGSAALLASRLRATERWPRIALFACFLTLTLVLFVKPTDVLWAAIGFTVAGALISLAAPRRRFEWAAFLVAIWLPIHLLTAVAEVAERSIRGLPAHVRTDPPPTAALVPFAMVVCALLGSRIVAAVRRSRD